MSLVFVAYCINDFIKEYWPDRASSKFENPYKGESTTACEFSFDQTWWSLKMKYSLRRNQALTLEIGKSETSWVFDVSLNPWKY